MRIAPRALLVALLATAVVLVAASSAAARPSGKLVPAEGVLLGAFLEGWGTNPYVNVEEFEGALGRRLDIDHRYWGWQDGWPYFSAAPYNYESWDVEGGRIPMVSWDYLGAGTLDDINAGTHDELIRKRAQKVREFGHELFVRWGYEMNAWWMPWSGSQNGNDPSKYVAAWRRIHDIFVEEGATNAVWVWAPDANDNPNEPWNDFRNYYPGDEYVDWVGIDGYNWGGLESWSHWQSFGSIFDEVYGAFAARKPIMIAETGSTETGGSKATWLLEMSETLKAQFPSVAAVVYFNYDHGGYDWSLSSSPEAFEAFRKVAADPYFHGDGVAPTPETRRVQVRATRPRGGAIKRIALSVNRSRKCVLHSWSEPCAYAERDGDQTVRVSVIATTNRPHATSFRLGVRGYRPSAVVFTVRERVRCVDRSAPFRCRVHLDRRKIRVRMRFRADAVDERPVVARVRVRR